MYAVLWETPPPAAEEALISAASISAQGVQAAAAVVVDPFKGQNVGYIPTGPIGQDQATAVGLPSNVEFGIGKDRDVLYITVDKSLYRIKLKTRGWHVQYQGRKKKL